MANKDYAVVLTSCGRFDLLRQTCLSFARYADILPRQFIVVEDSGCEEVREVLADISLPFEFVINRPRLGQAAAIDAGYARVKTDYVFHCQDDWAFFRSGFIAESFAVLDAHPKVSAIMLRGRDEHRRFKKLRYETIDGIEYFRARRSLHWYYFGYGYNPGLRRMADYKSIAPIAQIGGEKEVSFVFKQLGFCTAHLEVPAVRHLGYGRRALDMQPADKKSKLRKKLTRWQTRIKMAKWQLFGLPNRLRHPRPLVIPALSRHSRAGGNQLCAGRKSLVRQHPTPAATSGDKTRQSGNQLCAVRKPPAQKHPIPNLPPIFVISLARAAHRREAMRERLNALGLQYEIIDAIDGAALNPADYENRLRQDKFRRKFGRNMLSGEIGCYLSHYQLWQRIVAEKTPCALVLEDDAALDEDLFSVVCAISNLQWHWGVILLSCETQKTPGRVLATIGDKNWRLILCSRRLVSTAGYVISQQGARELLEHCREINAPIDVSYSEWWHSGIPFHCVVPSLVRQVEEHSFIKTNAIYQKASLAECFAASLWRKNNRLHRRWEYMKKIVQKARGIND